MRIPPFPGAKTCSFGAQARASASATEDLVDLVRQLRVGGSYWAAQPELPGRYVLVRCAAALQSAAAIADSPIVLWTEAEATSGDQALAFAGDCDPWHMLSGAATLVTAADDELCVIAAILGVPVNLYDAHAGTLEGFVAESASLLAEALRGAYQNPFSGSPMTARETVELCGFWRRLIDSNRDFAGGIGFAFWKQDHVAPLLWSGAGALPFVRKARDLQRDGAVAVWRVKTSSGELAALAERQLPVVEIEDGFLRSHGLGADCVPPLSLSVDRLGAHFDPSQPSELELVLQNGEFDDALCNRARQLRELIVAAGLGKYERGGRARCQRPSGKRRHILVPGQVEDDRAVQIGGCGLISNLDLLARVRAQATDAYILYKPHPDVLAGHRRGAMSDRLCLEHADEIVTGGAISSIIEMVDEVHVNTSLAGFEALLRETPVATYGVPFYAGWGLTRDLGPVPARRTARRTLDELVAATLLVYPRYLDPITHLPCPAEVLVERLCSGASQHANIIVLMRRLQGKLMRPFRSLGE